MQYGNSVGYSLFQRFPSVLVHFGFVLLSVSETTCAADAAAETSHTFDKVDVGKVFALFEKGDTTFVDTVARARFEVKVDVLLFERLRQGIAETAASCKDSSKVRSVVEDAFCKRGDVHIFAVEKGLQFLKSEYGIDVGFDFFVEDFRFLGGARTYKHDFCAGRGVLDVLGNHSHRRKVVRDMFDHIREVLFDIRHERGTARTCQEAFFGEFSCFGKQNHIRAECRFDNRVESEFFKPRNDLTEFCVGELAGNRGRDDGVKFVLRVVFALFHEVDYVENIGFVGNCAPGTLIYARAAFNALGIVDSCRAVLAHTDCLDFASHFARAFVVGDCAVRTNLCARAAFFTFCFVDVCDVLAVESKRAEFANVFATVSKTASASGGDFVAAHRTFVASDVDNLDYVGIVLVAAHSEFDSFTQNRAFFVHAAAHRRDFAGNYALWNVDGVFVERTCPRLSCDFAKNFIFEMLNFCIEYSHCYTFCARCVALVALLRVDYTPNRPLRNGILFRFCKNIYIFRLFSVID